MSGLLNMLETSNVAGTNSVSTERAVYTTSKITAAREDGNPVILCSYKKRKTPKKTPLRNRNQLQNNPSEKPVWNQTPPLKEFGICVNCETLKYLLDRHLLAGQPGLCPASRTCHLVPQKLETTES